MDLGHTVVVGLVAGATIVLGLPIGRMRRPTVALRTFLNAVTVGILLFLVWDVLSAAWQPVAAALEGVHSGRPVTGRATAYGLLFAFGLSVGLLSLVAYERWMRSAAGRRPPQRTPGAPEPKFGPGAMHVQELSSSSPHGFSTWSPGRQLALLIAVGIGLHNFAEGLAIGQSAARSEIALTTVLALGFGLHNATEGFGIVAPLAATADATHDRPTWGFLLGMGAIGGGPTLLGSVVGHSVHSDALATLFLTVAAGSIVYVVCQLLGVAAKARRPGILASGLLVGLLVGFATDAIVSVAGA